MAGKKSRKAAMLQEPWCEETGKSAGLQSTIHCHGSPEGIRSIKLAIDVENRSRSSKIIGLTSATPNEGKSTVALAVGQLIAHNGASVIVVDCDLRNPSLTRSVCPERGYAELSNSPMGGIACERYLEGSSTQMAFLPAIPNVGPPDPPSVLSSAELKQIFDELRKQYEFVIVDLSPLAGVD